MNNKIDLVVSFDTTGSMYPVLAQVRQEVVEFLDEMFHEFKDLRIGIIAHGDYCDKDDPYTIRIMNFSENKERLQNFVRETKKTYGGDADECYELVLHSAHNELNWRPDADKVMVMIGDASPHSPSYYDNKENLDWKYESEILRKEGIKVFAVHALSYHRQSSKNFYKTVAEITGGVYLTLDMFNEVVSLIEATCYQQTGEERLSEFITIIRESGKMTHSMDRNFKRLQGIEVEDTEYYTEYGRAARRVSRGSTGDVTLLEMDDLVPVLPGRFQTMKVETNQSIKDFIESNGIEFKKGRGFYELTKHEKVQQYKEVIMQNRETGEMFTGSQVRKRLGLQPQSEKGGVTENLSSRDIKEFRVFVQSTSYNRKLIGGTTLLYEISDLDDTGTVIDETPVTKRSTKKVEKDEPKKETKTTKETEEAKKKVEVSTVKKNIVISDDSAKKLKKAEAPKIDLTAKPMENVKKSLDKVADGLERYGKSKNKKNTTYLSNNLKKLIDETNKLLNAMRYK